jgi:hypothetical protein
MIGYLFRKNSISQIASKIPQLLVSQYGKKSHYSDVEVESVFLSTFKTNHNMMFAFAMFCSAQQFKVLNVDSQFSYSDLRTKVSQTCFDNWPIFNFDSLLNYSQSSGLGDSLTMIVIELLTIKLWW